MNETVTKIDRSNVFILAFQLEGLCAALRHCLSCGVAPDIETVETVRKLHETFTRIHSGPSLDILEPVKSSVSPAAVLVLAEILRSTVSAFLSPDELVERNRVIGFQR